MGIQLFPHNQKAYDAAVSLMKETGRAAVIHPTGTGKSFIAFRLAQDNPDIPVCWLSPSEHIFRTQLDNVKRAMAETMAMAETAVMADENPFPNITFLTYSRLMIHGKEAAGPVPGCIILDEFHRCGAEEWGRSVRTLLLEYPEAKVLGLSATSIRYLDSRRDMAMELFPGATASVMTLGEAIAEGILPAPVYVSALYPGMKQRRELDELERRASFPAGRSVPETARLLERLSRALERAQGPEEIFSRYIEKKDGRYLVFCADREHMEQMREKTQEWFCGIDRDPCIYTVIHDDPRAAGIIQAFQEDDSPHLKLLYCIDMLNEGIHIKGVDGVILLRPTASPAIYFQQIGRALSAGGDGRPLIFDLVDNFRSLSCIDCLEKEIREAAVMTHGTGQESGRPGETFRILDETRDCRTLFRQLQENLSAAWETCFNAAQEYRLEHGNLRVPASYVTDTGLALGSWISTQRKVRAGKTAGILTEEQTARLDAIGMIWNPREERWETGMAELSAYRKKYGNTAVKARYVTETGYPLGKWLGNLRCRAARGRLDAEKIRRLEALGITLDKQDRTGLYIKAAEQYRKDYGDLRVPPGYRSPEGISLGNWLKNLKNGTSGNRKRRELLTMEQRRKLEELGMEWEQETDLLWNRKYGLAKNYYLEHGNLRIPVSYCAEGVRLGRWISCLRSKRKNPQASGPVLSEERIRQLDEIGMIWEDCRKGRTEK